MSQYRKKNAKNSCKSILPISAYLLSRVSVSIVMSPPPSLPPGAGMVHVINVPVYLSRRYIAFSHATFDPFFKAYNNGRPLTMVPGSGISENGKLMATPTTTTAAATTTTTTTTTTQRRSQVSLVGGADRIPGGGINLNTYTYKMSRRAA